MSQQINLYDPRLRTRRFAVTPASALVFCAVLALLATALVAVYVERQARATAAQAQAMDIALKEANARRNKLLADHAARKPNAALGVEIAALDAQLKGRQEIHDALKSGALGSTVGFSDHMRSFSRQQVDGVWLTGFDIAAGGNDLTLAGRALRADLVPVYLKRLHQEKPLQGRQFATLRIQQPAARDSAQAAGGARKTTAVPRYLDFIISTGDVDDPGKRNVPRTMLQGHGTPALRAVSFAPLAHVTAGAAP